MRFDVEWLVRVHAIVVVADTSRGLTCHTRMGLPSSLCPADRAVRPRRSLHARVLSPFFLLLHPWFGPPGCIGTPAAIAVGRGPDTGDARASLHLRSTLRPLLSHRPRCIALLVLSPFLPCLGELALRTACRAFVLVALLRLSVYRRVRRPTSSTCAAL